MTRRIVDLKDVNTQELVYPATHSDAVLMPDGTTVTEAIANAGGGGGNGAVSEHIDVDSSGEYALTKDAANYANFNIADALCTFTFANSPTYENIIGGSWGEYKLYFFYSQNATISFNAGIVWGENCGAPIFEMGYIYEFSFVPIAFDNKVTWLGLWSKTAEKNIITIEFAYDSDLQCYTFTASESVSSNITFSFYNGLVAEMAMGESYAQTSVNVPEGFPMPDMVLGELVGDTVYDDYNLYKLVDKTT